MNLSEDIIMCEETENILTNEDRIKDIAERFKEVHSYCNLLYSAVTNEIEKPADSDLINSIYLLVEQLEKLDSNIQDYIAFCEQTGVFGHLCEFGDD